MGDLGNRFDPYPVFAVLHQFRDLNEVISQIKNRNYRFIIYMDDLSFEEFDPAPFGQYSDNLPKLFFVRRAKITRRPVRQKRPAVYRLLIGGSINECENLCGNRCGKL